MSNAPLHRTTKSVCLSATVLQPPLPDGSFMVPMNDPVDAIHAERHPEEAVDRHREMVMLDRLFWMSIALLMIVGLTLRVWILF
ncbi:hypothetical protein DTL42_24485 [Bremerella cremea]|uniref:Uncharacterized protein n=1 Tax=Bremerella cremea TaxID=1031537 RepID=A0A368KMH2_9BACT|nr:hypothetical protein [Bremerella cremea]RCS40535.1 hypothetical protein DTL42_24485 [Bremerella cremea]